MEDSKTSEYWPVFPRYADIPPLFHSLELDGPFQNCTCCHTPFTDPSTQYVIERIFRGAEPIVEYAMCMGCQESLTAELSEESVSRIHTFLAGLDHTARLRELEASMSEEDVSPWVRKCMVTGKSQSNCDTYQVVAVCRGSKIELSALPAMISDDGMKAIMAIMSQKTRDRMEEFMGDTFGMPPEFCEDPDLLPLIL